MRQILFFVFISLYFISFSRHAYSQMQEITTFLPTAEDFPNPERGFMGQADVWPDRTSDFNGIARANPSDTLIWIYFRLDNYRDKPLDVSGLNRIQAAFQNARSKKMKVVARFIYNFGPGWSTDKSQMTPDAPVSLVLQHIAQLKPIFQTESDAIAVVQIGFAGHWGEWHSSYHDLNIPPNSTSIIEALGDAVPKSIPLQMRYPRDKKLLYGESLTAQEGFNNSLKSRIGHHNDCFLADITDSGTYRTQPLQNPPQTEIDYWKNYIVQDGLYTPVGGESCAVNTPRTSCDVALKELSWLHWSFVNNEYYPEVLAGWEAGGCMSDIRKKLGYRFTLHSASFPPSASPGGKLDFTVNIKNEGFANLYSQRKVYIVFIGQNAFYAIDIGDDPRYWNSGTLVNIRHNITVPTSVLPGIYRIGLWLPDISERLRNDSVFSVRFANSNIWDSATGVNVLLDNFSVTGSGCLLKQKGDADCDGQISIADFEIWRKEYFKTVNTVNADFDANLTIDLTDFEQWRKGYFI